MARRTRALRHLRGRAGWHETGRVAERSRASGVHIFAPVAANRSFRSSGHEDTQQLGAEKRWMFRIGHPHSYLAEPIL